MIVTLVLAKGWFVTVFSHEKSSEIFMGLGLVEYLIMHEGCHLQLQDRWSGHVF